MVSAELLFILLTIVFNDASCFRLSCRSVPIFSVSVASSPNFTTSVIPCANFAAVSATTLAWSRIPRVSTPVNITEMGFDSSNIFVTRATVSSTNWIDKRLVIAIIAALTSSFTLFCSAVYLLLNSSSLPPINATSAFAMPWSNFAMPWK